MAAVLRKRVTDLSLKVLLICHWEHSQGIAIPLKLCKLDNQNEGYSKLMLCLLGLFDKYKINKARFEIILVVGLYKDWCQELIP